MPSKRSTVGDKEVAGAQRHLPEKGKPRPPPAPTLTEPEIAHAVGKREDRSMTTSVPEGRFEGCLRSWLRETIL